MVRDLVRSSVGRASKLALPPCGASRRRGPVETPAPFSPTRTLRPITSSLVVTRQIVADSESGSFVLHHTSPTAERPTCEQVLAVARTLLGVGRQQIASRRIPGCRQECRVTSVACAFIENSARARNACEGGGGGRCGEPPPRLGRTRCGAVRSRWRFPVLARVAVLSRSAVWLRMRFLALARVVVLWRSRFVVQ